MAFAGFADLCRQTSVSTGTGALVLQAAETGWRPISAGYVVDAEVPYVVRGYAGDGTLDGAFEIGRGHLNAGGELVRDAVFVSSNANAAVSFASASLEVFVAAGAAALAEVIAGAVTGGVAAHAVASDPHGDRAYAATLVDALGPGDVGADAAGTAAAAVGAHAVASDPHGDRAYAAALVDALGPGDVGADAAGTAAAAVGAHAVDSDPHGDRAFATSSIATHAGAADPHGDRAYVDAKLNSLNEITLNAVATPAAPAAGKVKVFGRELAGRVLPAVIGPSGLDMQLQTALARNKVASWSAPGGATTAPTALGAAALTATGTATTRGSTSGSLLNQARRLGYVSAAAAASLCGWRSTAALWWRGDAANLGGFDFVARFAVTDAVLVTDARMFIGLRNNTGAPTNVEPSTLTSIVGLGRDAADTNLQIMHNDGSGVATKVDLGAGFPHALNHLLELSLFCPPNGADIKYTVRNLTTGDVASGTLSTDLPASTTFLTFNCWRSSNATVAAVALDFLQQYIEVDT